MKKKIISFSLWGGKPMYTIGAIKNAKLAEEIYPGWTCRFYTARSSVPEDIINQLSELKNTELVFMDDPESRVETEPARRNPFTFEGTFWRFYAAADADVMICRDTDSRLGLREKFAVDEWLESDKDFHIMRDNEEHGAPICAGMWGVRNGLLLNINELVEDYQSENTISQFGDDQQFLAEEVYPLVVEKAMQHDHFFCVSATSKWTSFVRREDLPKGTNRKYFGRTTPFPADAGRSKNFYVGRVYGADE